VKTTLGQPQVNTAVSNRYKTIRTRVVVKKNSRLRFLPLVFAVQFCG